MGHLTPTPPPPNIKRDKIKTRDLEYKLRVSKKALTKEGIKILYLLVLKRFSVLKLFGSH